MCIIYLGIHSSKNVLPPSPKKQTSAFPFSEAFSQIASQAVAEANSEVLRRVLGGWSTACFSLHASRLTTGLILGNICSKCLHTYINMIQGWTMSFVCCSNSTCLFLVWLLARIVRQNDHNYNQHLAGHVAINHCKTHPCKNRHPKASTTSKSFNHLQKQHYDSTWVCLRCWICH